MKKRFVVKKLIESYEIQKSYDKQNYLEVVFLCRTYLESWLLEYIFAVLYPTLAGTNKGNRELIESRFNSMFIQLDWLLKQGYLSKNDFENINRVRRFCDQALRKGDVFKVVQIEELDKFIDVSIHYCQKLKDMTRASIEKATGQKIQL